MRASVAVSLRLRTSLTLISRLHDVLYNLRQSLVANASTSSGDIVLFATMSILFSTRTIAIFSPHSSMIFWCHDSIC